MLRTLNGRQGGSGGTPVPYDQAKIPLALFNLDDDIGETTDVKAQHPEVLSKMQALADQMRRELGDSATKTEGQGIRPAGKL